MAASVDHHDQPLVATSRGTVAGRRSNGVSAYLGVPYAAPPLGPHRFTAPAPHPRWGGIRPAIDHGPAPIQGGGSPGRALVDLSVPTQSEDCLTVSVWTPSADRAARLPVMVWFYGGAFLTGGNSVPAYDGARLAARGVVVVSVNYRLGLFGWLREPALGADGNQGLDDQVAALRWVHEEIVNFGGDPDSVTVFGESAGAGSIAAHLAHAGSEPLFHRAILQSGSYNLIGTLEEAADTTARLTAHLGLAPAQWRELDTETLRAAQDVATPRSAGVFYRPTADGVRLPTDPAATLMRNAPAVPLLCGTNEHEYGFYWGRSERFDTVSDEHLQAAVARLHDDPVSLVERYRTARQGRGEPVDNRSVGIAILSDQTFRVPVMALAEWQSRRAATFAYRFEHRSPLFEGLVGACHVLEVPFVFSTYDHPSVAAFTGYDVSPDEVTALSDQLATAWVRFATTGDAPWSRYDAVRRTTRRFAGPALVVDDPAGDERRSWDPLRLPR